MYFYRLLGTAGVAIGLAAASTCALAGSLTQPGISTGIPVGVTLPAGVYNVSALNYGSRTHDAGDLAVAVPVYLIHSTPWTVLGGRIQLQALAPLIDYRDSKAHRQVGHNNYAGAWLGWNLGNDLHLNVGTGVIPRMDTFAAANYTSYQHNVALSYWPANHWELTANAAYGTGKRGPKSLGAKVGPSWANLDLTALKNISNYQIGVIAFTSNDLERPYASYARQSQVAVGGVVGYRHGFTNVQLKVSRDVSQSHHGGHDTRVWLTAAFLLHEILNGAIAAECNA